MIIAHLSGSVDILWALAITFTNRLLLNRDERVIQLAGPLFLCLLILYLTVWLVRARKKQRIRQWQQALRIPEHQAIFDHLYSAVDGFKLSRLSREKQDAFDYVYGEIEFLPFLAFLSLVPLDKNTVFYDLGSGTGKAVLAAAMVYPLKRSVGIEIMPELHAAACGQKNKLATLPAYAEAAEKIDFFLGDFLEADLREANCVFINATAFIGETWSRLCEKLETLPRLTTVITTSKVLISTRFILVKSTKIMMSWGVVLCYIHVSNNTKY